MAIFEKRQGKWVDVSGIPISDSYTKDEANAKFSTKIQLNEGLATKVDITALQNYYTAKQTDDKFATKKLLTDNLALKADKSTVTLLDTKVENHIINKSNPHGVTKAQVGLGSVDNTSDLAKPISTKTQEALDLKADSDTVTGHINNKANPHKVTKAQVGLGNVDNTSDLAKPVSTATQTALNLKADKTEIPTKTSQLTNNSGFITKAVNDLTNYYTKSNTYNRAEIESLIAEVPGFLIEVVEKLPPTGAEHTVYLVPNGEAGNNVRDEYLWVNGKWELIGSTVFHLDITQDANGITINDVELQNASTSHDGLMTKDLVKALNNKLYRTGGSMTGYLTTLETAQVRNIMSSTTKPADTVGMDGDVCVTPFDSAPNTLQNQIDSLSTRVTNLENTPSARGESY